MMRQKQMRAQRAQAGRRGTARDVPFPLPLKGLFSEAKNAEVSGAYAAELKNWRSSGLSMETRPQSDYVSGVSNLLQRIPYEFSGASAYIETYPGKVAAGSSILFRAFNDFADAAYISGHAVIADGRDVPTLYDGTELSEAAFTASDGTDPASFDGVLAHHDRLIFWKRGGPLDFYYGDVGAITGELERFPLGRLGSITGSIADILSLTVDAGHGMNDTLCIVTTTGQMILYEGLDPGDATDWRLVSRVKAAPPASGKPFTQVGSDLWMVTTSGIVSVTEALRRGALALVSEISRPVADAILKQVQAGGDWQLHTAADGSQVIINHILDGVAKQWIFHVESRSWAAADYPAQRWHNLGTDTQFTHISDGRLGHLNRAATGDEKVTAVWHSSWFRLPRAQGMTALIPHILARAPLTVRVAVLTDHDTTSVDLEEAWQTVTLNPDNDGNGSEIISLNDRIGIDAVGSAFQIRMEVTAKWAEIVSLQVSLQ